MFDVKRQTNWPVIVKITSVQRGPYFAKKKIRQNGKINYKNFLYDNMRNKCYKILGSPL